MSIEKCTKCGSDLLEIVSTPYYENILGQRTFIGTFQGVQCLQCKHVHFDEEAREFIRQTVQVKKTERMQDSDYTPIIINYTKKLRLQTRLSQKMIGNALGVTEQRYGTIERNTNTPTVVTEHQIAAILGVKTDDLYKLIYISKSFYEDLKDMELYEENGESFFSVVEPVREKRRALAQVREEIQKINDEKRTIRNKHKNGLMSLSEFKEKINKLEKERMKLVEKKGKTPDSGLQGEVKKVESKYNLIVKQENVVDAEDWEKIAEEYKDTLKDWLQ